MYDLGEWEQFITVMRSVLWSHLHPFIFFLFKLSFQDHVNNIKLGIMAVTAACEELKETEGFGKLLESCSLETMRLLAAEMSSPVVLTRTLWFFARLQT